MRSNLSIIYGGEEEEQTQEQECYQEAACITEWESRYKKSADNQTSMIRGRTGAGFEECPGSCHFSRVDWGDGNKAIL